MHWQCHQPTIDRLRWLQGVVWLAKRGRAHCDIKVDNIRIKVGDDGTICGLKVIDLGGSIKYKGKVSDAELLVVVPSQP